MSEIVNRLRHPKERLYSAMILTAGIVLWTLFFFIIIASLFLKPFNAIIDILEIIVIVLVVMAAGAWYRARAFGNMIMLGTEQCPTLYNMVAEGARSLGLAQTPTTFLYNSHGLVNAMARRLFGRRYVFLTSALVEIETDEQVKFVIGHELGHHAAGHLNPMQYILKLPGHFVPFLGPAYSRAREYTCDSIGAHLSQDFEASRTALQMLGCGCKRLNNQMNCDAFIAQEAMVPSIFGFISEIFRSHPRLTRRVGAIRQGLERQF